MSVHIHHLDNGPTIEVPVSEKLQTEDDKELTTRNSSLQRAIEEHGKGMAAFCKPFTTGKVKYFDRMDKDKAKQWLLAEA